MKKLVFIIILSVNQMSCSDQTNISLSEEQKNYATLCLKTFIVLTPFIYKYHHDKISEYLGKVDVKLFNKQVKLTTLELFTDEDKIDRNYVNHRNNLQRQIENLEKRKKATKQILDNLEAKMGVKRS